MSRAFSFLTALTLSTLLIGVTTSLIISLLFCIFILGLWVLYQSFQQQRFLDWLKNTSYKPILNGYGIWKLIYSSANSLLKKGELQESKLKNNLAAFRRATEAMEDGILVIDNNNYIVAVTPRAEHYLNISQEQDYGTSILNHIRHPSFVEYLLSGSLNKTIIIEDLSLDKKALEFKLLPFDATQKIILCRDVTKLRQLEVEKKDFVASASHELKTPLTVITGYLETIFEIEINKVEKNRMLAEMLIQTKRMDKLINDLLLLSKLEKSDTSQNKTQVNISLLTHELSKLSGNINKDQHTICFDIEDNVFVSGTKDNLRSAFWNLINNAIIYTEKGGKIEVSCLNTEEGRAVFIVKDNGIGIEAYHIDKLTERFFRVDSSGSRESKGTGLGLSIVNEIVQKHGASLKIQSQPNVGSKFSIIFPADV
ncbi:phosphate regulon sensor histidine kinase PhoR [Betaproteobacteria bacterium]|nr:phosphate regulon sensor histidine kinase PhoR [Betaproteobacteria bacterium]